MAFSSVRSACGRGTLHCGAEDKPTVCDFTRNYVLNSVGDACEQKIVDGCRVLNPAYTESRPCMTCDPNKVFDVFVRKCVDVAADKARANCVAYADADSSCVGCEDDHFLDDGACRAVSAKVENCAFYSSLSTCSACKGNHYLSGNQCKEIAKIENCYSHSLNRCDECTAGYILNRGLNAEVAITAGVKQSLARGDQASARMSTSNLSSVCEKKDARNCMTFATATTCEVCEAGYMLNWDQKCRHYPEPPIPNCIEYSAATTCAECANSTHFLLGNACVDRQNKVDHCARYRSEKDECQECKSTHYLSAATECALRTHYDQCAKPSRDKDECLACLSGDTLTADKFACLADPVYCAEFDPAADKSRDMHKCRLCEDGFTLTEGVCGGAKIPDCRSHATNKSECEECLPGKFLAQDRLACRSPDIGHCERHSSDKNSCIECRSLYYPTSPAADDYTANACVPIADPNCHSSLGFENECHACKNDYFKPSGAACTQRAQPPHKCLSNLSPVDDTECDACEALHVMVSGARPVLSESEMAANNCLALDAATGDCEQCRDDHYLADVGVCKAAPTPINCTRRKPSTAPAPNLQAITDCEICNRSRGYFADSTGTCRDLPFSNLVNCEAQATTESECIECSAGTVPIPDNLYTCVGDSTGGRLSIKNPDCAVQMSPTECYSCASGKAYDSSSGDCVDTSIKVERALDYVGSPIGAVKAAEIEGCERYGQVSPYETVCVKCGIEKVAIVDNRVGGYTPGKVVPDLARVISADIGGVTHGPNHTTYNHYVACVDQSEVLGNVNKFTNSGATPAEIAARKCMLGIALYSEEVSDEDASGNAEDEKSSLLNKYACIRCARNQVGTVKQIQRSRESGGVTLKTPLMAIVDCSAPNTNVKAGPADPSAPASVGREHSRVLSFNTSFSSSFGVGYAQRFDTATLSLNSFFNILECAEGYTPVYNLKRANANSMPFEFAYEGPSVTCEQPSAFQIPNFIAYTGNPDNCALFISPHSIPYHVQHTLTVDFECVACKPNCEPQYQSGTGTIVDCIEKVEMTNNLMVKSASQNEPYNAVPVGENGMLVVEFDQINTTYTGSNCRVAHGVKCVICDATYTPDEAQHNCVPISGDNIDPESVGLGQTALRHPGMGALDPALKAEAVKQFLTVSQIRHQTEGIETYLGYKSVIGDACSNPADFFYYSPGDGSSKMCGKSARSAFINPTAGCAKPGVGGGCSVCADPAEYIPSTAAVKCVAKSSRPDCASVGVGDRCETCEGSSVLEDGACVESNCKLHNADKSICIVCSDRSRPLKSGTKDRCEGRTDADSAIGCLNFDGQNGKCVKCSDASKIPINFVYTSTDADPEITIKTWSCVTWARTGTGEGGYKTEYTYIQNDFTVPGDTTTSQIHYLAGTGWESRQVNDYTKGDKTSEKNCVPGRTVEHCANYRHFYCDSCNDGYSLDSDENKCVALADQNCRVGNTHDRTKCVACEEGFWVNNGVCTARTTGQNCKEFNRLRDECIECEATRRYLDSATKACKSYTAKECKTYDTGRDLCASCNDKSWMSTANGTVVCQKPTPVEGCKTYSTTADACIECSVETYYSVTDGSAFSCEKRTAISECEQYQPAADECLACKSGHYYNSTARECRQYPSGTPDCAVYTYLGTCTQCVAEHYLAAGKCEAVATENQIAGCAVYKSGTACQTCSSNYVLNGDKCDAANSNSGCLEFSDRATCSKCEDAYFLKQGRCVNSNIAGCVEPVENASGNTCGECISSRYLSEDKKTCIPGDIAGCVAFESRVRCTRCDSGKILSADRTECEDLGSKAGGECDVGSVQTEVFCDVCKFGFQKDNSGKCTKIDISDCVAVDKDGKCMLCMPNFSMYKDGNCTSNEEPPIEPERVCILRLVVVMALASVLIRWS